MTRRQIRKTIEMNEASIRSEQKALEPKLEQHEKLYHQYRRAVRNRWTKRMTKLDEQIAALHEHELGPKNRRILWLEGDIRRLQRQLTGN